MLVVNLVVRRVKDDAPLGGKFGVAEGADAAKLIVKLVDAAASKGAKNVGTRDYHPKNTLFFLTQWRPIPCPLHTGATWLILLPTCRAGIAQGARVWSGRLSGLQGIRARC